MADSVNYTPGNWSYTPPSNAGGQAYFQPYTPVASTWTPSSPNPPASSFTTQQRNNLANQLANVPYRPAGGRSWIYGVTSNRPIAPDQWQSYPGMSEGLQGPIYNMWDPTSYTTGAWNEISKYLQGWYFPEQEAIQNAYQWSTEYDEAARRWDIENQQQASINAWEQALGERQQQMSEWEANQAAQQWAEQFGWTQTTDTWSRDIAREELANQIALQNLQNESALAVARMNTYGRASAPNAMYRRNWS